MEFHPYYLGCLAHASYLVGGDGEAAVVDPQRDIDQYLRTAEERGLRIRWVIETHLHADFVSGHRELAERTGATIVFGAAAQAALPHLAVRDGDELPVGALRLRVLETPGHTPESISILVIEPALSLQPRLVLTGDTLFVGDVGRPDLAGGSGFTSRQMAEALHASLHGKLLHLADDVAVWPAHGAGSLCGRALGQERSSTIGTERRTNYALQPMSRDAFVDLMTTDLPEVPSYFARDAALNRTGLPALTVRPAAPALPPAAVDEARAGGATLLDTRGPGEFGAGHVPGSLLVGLGGQFASWCGALVPPDHPVVLVTAGEDAVAEAALRLARVGLENVAGFLDGGVAAWAASGRAVRDVPQVAVGDLAALCAQRRGTILDVRRAPEFAGGHVPGARNLPLDRLVARPDLDPGAPTFVICQGGYRSSAAASLLLRHGFTDVVNVVGGTAAWKAAGLALET